MSQGTTLESENIIFIAALSCPATSGEGLRVPMTALSDIFSISCLSTRSDHIDIEWQEDSVHHEGQGQINQGDGIKHASHSIVEGVA